MQHFLTAAIAAAILLGCGASEHAEHATGTSPAVQRPEPVAELLSAYEDLRDSLVNDKGDSLPDAFHRLHSAAGRSRAEVAPGPAREPFEKLLEAASAGAEIEGDDLKQARETFGEVSEHLVAAMISEPSLRQGLYLFECPMVEGYAKWVQTSDSIGNPYMGKEMPTCGVESKWSE